MAEHKLATFAIWRPFLFFIFFVGLGFAAASLFEWLLDNRVAESHRDRLCRSPSTANLRQTCVKLDQFIAPELFELYDCVD
jgi:hypothetical protein